MSWACKLFCFFQLIRERADTNCFHCSTTNCNYVVLAATVLSSLKELSSIYFYWHVSLENLIESDVCWRWISLVGRRACLSGCFTLKTSAKRAKRTLRDLCITVEVVYGPILYGNLWVVVFHDLWDVKKKSSQKDFFRTLLLYSDIKLYRSGCCLRSW